MVSPSILWKEIDRNIESFSSDTKFDGGFSVPPIGKIGWKESDFGVNGLDKFAMIVRDIRNALSHGRDQRTVTVITPTPSNFRLLLPWASLIALAAGEVMVYKNT